ncbi:hypothetical protein [Paenibacillus solani]|uniref:hypothetical protein n=1 Tax=Paenibacillus solani TaxID=1705565 RepID=UPI001A93B109|nr:hypothetical protein [Paenibacillus solani]
MENGLECLEAFDISLLLAIVYHIKNLSGRKTDMKDAEWIAKLLRCGLIEGSFSSRRNS